MSNEITLKESNEVGFVETKPNDVVIKATEAAKELQKIVNNRSKKLLLGGKQYLYFEDWQTLGKFDNTTAKVTDTEEIREEGKLIGFTAKAVALKNGMEISAAEAECCFDERNWKDKPRFQLKSMAQTRACAKALRNCLAFIAVLANYEPTPAEEMDGNTNNYHSSPQHMKQQAEKVFPANDDKPSDIQMKQIYGEVFCEDCGKRVFGFKCPKCGNTIDNEDESKRLHVEALGFIHSHFLTKDDFNKTGKMYPAMSPPKLTKRQAIDIYDWWITNGERKKREELEEVEKAVNKKEKEEQGSSYDNALPFKGKRKSLQGVPD